MTTFTDGPAQGQRMMLHRAAKFLRVTEAGGKFDALDQLSDEPKPEEKLYAYVIAGHVGSYHIHAKGGRGGFYPIATYRLVPEQPSDATMRLQESWAAWCLANKDL